jgi:hypothetical protein
MRRYFSKELCRIATISHRPLQDNNIVSLLHELYSLSSLAHLACHSVQAPLDVQLAKR